MTQKDLMMGIVVLQRELRKLRAEVEALRRELEETRTEKGETPESGK